MTRILIVEDDPVQSAILARALGRRRPDFTFLTVSNGAEAIRLVSEQAVDLIITDITLPRLDGFQLLTWVGGNCPEVPVFVISGAKSDDARSRCMELGAVAYFAKPLDLRAIFLRMTNELSQTVRGHVQNVSLASFLQLMDMERKTCTLSVCYAGKSGSLVLRKGELIAAESGNLSGEAAAIAIIAWPNPSIAISSQLATRPRSIEKPLNFIIMEAMRVQDELMHNAPASEWPVVGRTLVPSGTPLDAAVPRRRSSHAAKNGHALLSSGVRAVAIVETATGDLLRSAAVDGVPVRELARMAAQVLRQQTSVVSICDQREGIEELVFSTNQHCDLVRPLGVEANRFAMLIFTPEETNLAMARLELERYVFTQGRV